MTAERPDTDLAVICGSLHIADEMIGGNVEEYLRNLGIGHVLPIEACQQSAKLDIIYEGFKYSLEAFQVCSIWSCLDIAPSSLQFLLVADFHICQWLMHVRPCHERWLC